MSLVARHLEANGIPTVVIAAARDIVEHCGVARMLHVNFPLGNPCGVPHDALQQQDVLEHALALLECAQGPRSVETAPYRWPGGEDWKAEVFSEAFPWKSGEDEQDWLQKKALYRQLKAEGKV